MKIWWVDSNCQPTPKGLHEPVALLAFNKLQMNVGAHCSSNQLQHCWGDFTFARVTTLNQVGEVMRIYIPERQLSFEEDLGMESHKDWVTVWCTPLYHRWLQGMYMASRN